MGYSHEEMAARLRENRIEPEFSGGGKIVLMVSPQNPEEDFLRLENCFPAEAKTDFQTASAAARFPKRYSPCGKLHFLLGRPSL